MLIPDCHSRQREETMEKLSVVILTFNEARNIKRCIESVLAVADEIVIVDSYSTDTTPDICRAYNVRFYQHPFEGYIEQKNYAASLTQYDYILSLDADEALSELLTQSILAAKHIWKHDGYTMNRLTSYCGQWIHHSGWYPDTKLRLFKKNKAVWAGVNPHDKVEMHHGATITLLEGDLHHYSYYTFEEHKAQIVKFAEISASALYKKGVRSDPAKIIYKPVARFIRSYIVKAGFMDGKAGWTIARMTAWASFLRYTQLYKLQKKSL